MTRSHWEAWLLRGPHGGEPFPWVVIYKVAMDGTVCFLEWSIIGCGKSPVYCIGDRWEIVICSKLVEWGTSQYSPLRQKGVHETDVGKSVKYSSCYMSCFFSQPFARSVGVCGIPPITDLSLGQVIHPALTHCSVALNASSDWSFQEINPVSHGYSAHLCCRKIPASSRNPSEACMYMYVTNQHPSQLCVCCTIIIPHPSYLSQWKTS